MHLGEAEQIPENTTENAVGNKVATLAPFEEEENKESETKLKGKKEDKGAEIIANAKKGDLTSNGDHVDVLKQHIEDHRLCLVFRELTGTDGNCWYRAGADQVVLHDLPELPRDHRALRQLVTSRIPSLPQYADWLNNVFGGDVEAFDQFLHHHSQNGVWTDASGILCQATALIFKRQIAVIGTNNENPRGFFILESVPGSEELPALTIGHYYEQHYQSLAPLMEDGRKEEEDLASNQDGAAKEGDEEKEPNTEDKSLSAEEKKGGEINLGKEGGLSLGLT